MRLALLLFFLLVSPAFAQQATPVEQAVKAQLGELMLHNIAMSVEVKRLTEENAKLKAELEKKK